MRGCSLRAVLIGSAAILYNLNMRRMGWWMLGLLWWSCSSPPKEEPTPPQQGDALYGVTVRERRPGAPAWILRAKEMQFRGDTLRVHPVRLWFLSPRGDTLSRLRADSGWVLERSGEMEALGKVVVEAESDTLYTSQLAWDPRIRKIVSHAPIRVHRPEDVVHAREGLQATPDLSEVRFLGEVRVEKREAGETLPLR